MRLLVVTNLYPPQELGGYGRAIADFVWALRRRGHQLQVLSSDAPYLGPSGSGPDQEPVERRLQLLGSYERGVIHLENPTARRRVEEHNQELIAAWLKQIPWDGILLGNLDLLGLTTLKTLLSTGIPLLHHVGFVAPPFSPEHFPQSTHYKLVAASHAVRFNLVSKGLPVGTAPVVYPGARTELFEHQGTGRPKPPLPEFSALHPLRIGCASLLMESKGIHTLLAATAMLRNEGLFVDLMLAGGLFQATYVEQLRQFTSQHGLSEQVHFLGQLTRPQLARFLGLQHAFVFPSIAPEAFGIIAAEAMASGLALISSGAGGACELFEPEISGLSFRPGDAKDLAKKIKRLRDEPGLLQQLQRSGETRVREQFDVQIMAAHLEQLWSTGTILG